jgi:hypothetical protein
MENHTPASILQEATFKMAMLYEEQPNQAMFAVRSYFTGEEAAALVRTGLWERTGDFLIPAEHNLYYRYLYNKNAWRRSG